jgi:hypothetical protein
MTEEMHEVASEIRDAAARERRQGWVMLFSVIGNILTLIIAVSWTAREQAATERKFCAVLSVQDSPTPPTTERGKQVAEAVRNLRASLGCPASTTTPRVTPSPYGPPPSTTGR